MGQSSGKIIAVDFDSTIAFDAWPNITDKTKPNLAVINWLKKRKSKGDKVILWTCRENFGGVNFPDHEYKNDAVRFCTRNQLFFDNVNANYGEHGYEQTKYGRKLMADVYVDDRAVPFRRNKLLWTIYLWLIGRKLDNAPAVCSGGHNSACQTR